MRRKFKTDADIDRHIKAGFGQGEGSSYKPWIRVQDVPSIGRSRKTPGNKSGRIHHTLSDLEYSYLLLAEFSDEVVDIREQYPLFATARAKDIAAEMGIRYPMFAGTQLPYVMTSDFVLTIAEPNGKRRFAARTCKYENQLADPVDGPRTIQKLELEKAILADQGVTDWKIVTESLVGTVLHENLDWLHKSAWSVDRSIDPVLQRRFAETVVAAADGYRTLSSVVRSAASTAGIPYRDGTALFKTLVWRKTIRIDIAKVRLDITLPCPRVKLAQEN
jgi:hypothetical protein